MNRMKVMKGIVKKIIAALFIILLIIILGFSAHILKVNKENSTLRTITPESATTDVVANIYPRGQVTDKWEKDNAFPDKTIYAQIYEAAIKNNSEGLMHDWSIRINIVDECYLNNAWCGKVEVHQFVNGTENMQVIDLRDYEETEIKVKHIMAGQDLLIPLSRGDYIIYRSDGSGVSGESPLESSKMGKGQATIGIIFYSEKGEVDLSDYTLNYYIKKSYLSGPEGMMSLIIFIIWLLVFSFSAVVSVLIIYFEGRLYGRDRLVEDAFKLCASVADIKDSYALGHSHRTAKYASMIAEQMGMDKVDCENVYYVAMIHDIGNYFVAEQILRKNDRLSRDEFESVKMHTTKGAELVREIESLPHAVEGVLYHHEKYDGSGYPMGMKGDEIPLIARIIAVADAFDAMNSDRPYRSRLTSAQIRSELKDNKGIQFDPVIVDIFMEIIDTIEE